MLLAIVIHLLLHTTPVGAEYYPVYGNITVVGKPGFPVRILENQIEPGEVWTYTYDFEEGHTYHIYLTGDWVDLQNHLTDYDIYLYKVNRNTLTLISSHTEAAGYPEQVGNDAQGWFFQPPQTGTYYICIRNDPQESQAAEEAILMVIEKIEPDIHYVIPMKEPGAYDNPLSSYAFSFTTDQPRITVNITVPPTLDMYEARLYSMANMKAGIGLEVRGLTTPWSPGLLGYLNKGYGGFNDDPQGYRDHGASASCERYGQDMLIDYQEGPTTPTLYFLVLIAEKGKGKVSFVLRTDFTPPNITLVNAPGFAASNTTLPLRANITDDSTLGDVSFRYSLDQGLTWRSLPWEQNGTIYTVQVPPQPEGTIINYQWTASDSLGNKATKTGEIRFMKPTTLTLLVEPSRIYGGETVHTQGYLGLPLKQVRITYTGRSQTNFTVTTDRDGYFSHWFTPNQVGDWNAQAFFPGDTTYWPSQSNKANFTVERKPTTLSMNISRKWIGLGDYVNITGRFSEPRVGYEVFINARNGLNTTQLLALTDENGTYRTTFTPPAMGEWTLYAEVPADGIYTEAAHSLPKTLEVRDPTLAYMAANWRDYITKPPLVYGLGATLGGGTLGGLTLARRRGLLRNPLSRGGAEEETVGEGGEELDEDLDEEDFEF